MSLAMECRKCGCKFQPDTSQSSANNCCGILCLARIGVIPVRILEPVETKRKAESKLKLTKLRKRVEHKRATARRQKGKRNRNKGFKRSQEYSELRYLVLRHYGRACMLCQETKNSIEVDHIKPASKYPELALDIMNLQVLCRPCNLGKLHNYEDDFRPPEKVLALRESLSKISLSKPYEVQHEK